jgi:hypothetical protein
MELAYGYLALALQTHDELVASRMNERRRMAAERRAEAGGSADRTDGVSASWRGSGLGHRFAEWRRGREHDRIQGLPVAH